MFWGYSLSIALLICYPTDGLFILREDNEDIGTPPALDDEELESDVGWKFDDESEQDDPKGIIRNKYINCECTLKIRADKGRQSTG